MCKDTANKKNLDALRADLENVAAAGRAAYGLIKAGKMTVAAARRNPLYISISHGNKKLVENSRDAWLIYNLPAVITCPYATKDCINLCYARKAERLYKNVSAARNNNYIDSLDPDYVNRLIYTVYVELAAAEKKNKRLNIRIHESGDFYSRAYFEKWLSVGLEMAERENVVFFVYTKSFDFIDSPAEAQLLNIRGSVWNDTSAAALEKIDTLQLPVYTADTAENIAARLASGEKFHVCRCSDCATCRACSCGKIKNIVCEIH